MIYVSGVYTKRFKPIYVVLVFRCAVALVVSCHSWSWSDGVEKNIQVLNTSPAFVIRAIYSDETLF